MAAIYIGNIKGPKGDTGETGATGATGAAGSNGADGAAASVSIGTVTTVNYGTPASVTNSGTSSAAVLDFEIPQGKPGEETELMSALTLDAITASTANQPVPAVGETGSVVWGKVIKFFNDVKSALTNKINYNDCVKVLTNTSDTLPLAASQGKALNDAYTKLNGLHLQIGTIAASSSKAITLPTGYRGVMIALTGSSNSRGMWLLFVNNAGNTSYKDVAEASDITLTTSTNNRLTVANAYSGTVTLYLLNLSSVSAVI